MGRLPMLTAIVAGALALTACGASDGGSNSTTPAPAAAAAPTNTVRLATASGIGQVLVDSIGRTLYTPDEEKTGAVVCVDSCTTVWKPLKPAAAKTPTGAAGVPALAVIDRPDGSKQVTVGGRPLYTFATEVPGSITGQNVADDFGSQHLTWHVVMSDGTISVLPAPIGRTSPYGEGGY
jgi:predicted lipoprotein with Yx(FWY)xxD motif